MEHEEMVQEEALDTPIEEVELDEVDGEAEEPDYKALYEAEKKVSGNQKKRAEKAEKKSKDTPAPNSTGMSALDIIALSKADVAEEDLDEVLDYAKYKGISIQEALKSNVVKATLANQAEVRKSAQAVSTGSTRRGGSEVSDDRLLEDANSGKLPKSDSDMARLVKLQMENK